MSRPFGSETKTPEALLEVVEHPSKRVSGYSPHLSVAIWSFAIDDRSSWLPAAEREVSGVLAVLPFADPVGVLVDVPVVSLAPLDFADCFAAFSARRFCLDAEGAMVVVWWKEACTGSTAPARE